MVIFIIYISAFSSFISSAEGKRRSRTQAKRKQHALKELLPFQGVWGHDGVLMPGACGAYMRNLSFL
jgi:hypothetical protein